LTWSFLFVFLIFDGSNFGEESLRTESVIWSLDFGNKFYKWEFEFEVLMRKHIKWVKNLLQREPFMPLSQEFILSINL
jgi:hypothetical protein